MRIYFISLALLATSLSFAQQKPQKSDPASGNPATEVTPKSGTGGPVTPKTGPKPLKLGLNHIKK